MIAVLWAGIALASDWGLVGLYDLAAVSGKADSEAWLWTPYPEMTEACGAAKSPDGIGITEAQAIATRATPALVVLLRRSGAKVEEQLDTRNLQLGIGRGKPEVRLAPAVLPRDLRVRVTGSGDPRLQQMVRTQLAMELCLEHKTGRRWAGGTALGLRQAFLLNSPPEGVGADKMFFRGQRESVSALLGPPRACEVGVESEGQPSAGATSSLSLVPADVWGAGLPHCPETSPARQESSLVPLWLGMDRLIDASEPQLLNVEVVGGSNETTTVSVMVDDLITLKDKELQQRTATSDASEAPGMVDILASVPSQYPHFKDAHGETVALIVPDWQIAGALKRLSENEKPIETADAVGWLLRHPEALFVQVGDPDEPALPNLTSRYSAPSDKLLRWGFVAGGEAAGEKILTLDRPATYEQTIQVHRSAEQALFLLCVAVVGLILPVGIWRIRELWAVVPEERMLFWPEQPGEDSQNAEPAAPALDPSAGE